MSAIVELEPFFTKYECSEILISEYRNRAHGFKPNRLYRCPGMISGNIFYAVVDSQRALRIYKYTSQWNEFKTIQQAAPRYESFGMALHNGKLYIMGGKVSYDNYSKAVSTRVLKTQI